MEEKEQFKTIEEKVIEISRVSRTMKGGKRISFRALVVVGDRGGSVGVGKGKSNEVASAIKKAAGAAKAAMIRVPINEEGTIPQEVTAKFGSAQVLLRPAPEGTSIIAGGVTRAVCELSGLRNIVTKSFGSSNKINVAAATIKGLSEATKDVRV